VSHVGANAVCQIFLLRLLPAPLCRWCWGACLQAQRQALLAACRRPGSCLRRRHQAALPAKCQPAAGLLPPPAPQLAPPSPGAAPQACPPPCPRTPALRTASPGTVRPTRWVQAPATKGCLKQCMAGKQPDLVLRAHCHLISPAPPL
jgi:hypothetical protein